MQLLLAMLVIAACVVCIIAFLKRFARGSVRHDHDEMGARKAIDGFLGGIDHQKPPPKNPDLKNTSEAISVIH